MIHCPRVVPGVLLFFALYATAGARSSDPPTPPQGFPIVDVAANKDLLVTFGDGYKTRVDVRYPAPPPGACGWPIVVTIHGIGGSKDPIGTALVSTGYFTVAYDVRGQGSSQGLNTSGGCQWLAQRERLDLKEVLDFVEGQYGALCDSTRIAVRGASQGGQHAYFAAAFSGLPIEPNPWGASGVYPTLVAAVAENANPDWRQSFCPDAATLMPAFAGFFSDGSPPFGVVFDGAVMSTLTSAMLAENYPAIAAYLAPSDPAPLVSALSVPLMMHAAFDDHAFAATPIPHWIATLPSTTPWKLYLGTGGHGSPDNTTESLFRSDWRRRWLDRFMKGVQNGIDQGPHVEYARTPGDAASYAAPGSLWSHRTSDAWPPKDTLLDRRYLRQGSALASAPPNSAEPADPLVNTVAPGFHIGKAASGGFNASMLLSQIPNHDVVFDGAVFSDATEIAGTPRIHVELNGAPSRFQIAAALVAVLPDNSERWISDGFKTVDGPGGVAAVEFELHPAAMLVPAGNRLRLKLRNVARDDSSAVGATTLRATPVFQDFTVGIEHSLARPSWIDVPRRPADVSLSASTAAIPVAAGGTSALTISCEAEYAGRPYLVLGSLSGSTPGFSLNGVSVPLAIDAATTILLALTNTPVFPGFQGTLSATGGASAAVNIPAASLPSSLVGMDLTLAAILFDSQQRVTGASNPLVLGFVP